MSKKEKFNIVVNTILLPILFIIILPVKMLLINPIARLIGTIIGRKSQRIVNKYLERIYELRVHFKYAEAISLCNEAMEMLGDKYSKTDITVLMIQIQQVVIHALLSQYTKSEEKMALFEISLEEAEFVSNNVAIEYHLGKALLAEHRNQLQLADLTVMKLKKIFYQ